MKTLLARIHSPSLRQGLLFGLILGGVQIIFGFISSFITQPDILSIFSSVALVLFIVFGFTAGRRATRETGRLGTGAAAGIWTGLIGALLDALVPLIYALIYLPTIVSTAREYIKTHPDQFRGYNPASYGGTDVMRGILENLLVYTVLYILISLIGGTLGGALARRGMPAPPDEDEQYEEEAMARLARSKKKITATDAPESAE